VLQEPEVVFKPQGLSREPEPAAAAAGGGGGEEEEE
jgi:hypothetical protein